MASSGEVAESSQQQPPSRPPLQWLLKMQKENLLKAFSRLVADWHLSWQPLPSVYECMCECDKCCEALPSVSRLLIRYRNVTIPYTRINKKRTKLQSLLIIIIIIFILLLLL